MCYKWKQVSEDIINERKACFRYELHANHKNTKCTNCKVKLNKNISAYSLYLEMLQTIFECKKRRKMFIANI